MGRGCCTCTRASAFNNVTYPARFSEGNMARTPKLASLSVESLVKLRDDVAAALSQKADAVRKEIASLGSDYARVGRIAIYGRSSLKGRKVAPKYRDPKTGETWAGRGARPRWLVARIKAGQKRENFLIDKPRKSRKKARPSRKKARRKK
jgi:DNA-binding protein H-NS